jgi:CDP-4-dehydro-6-deoxyglucose reductase, E3
MVAMPDTTRRGRVVGLASLSQRVTELMIRIEGDEPFHWLAGQHVLLHPDVAGAEACAFSIAASPAKSEPGLVTLAVRNGAEVLDYARLGSLLAIEGPFGALVWHDAPGALLVGAGTGVAPLRAIAQDALLSGQTTPLVLVAGNRTSADLSWHAELVALAVEHSRFRYEPVVSQPDALWTGRRRYVQDHLGDIVTDLPRGFRAYLCGSVRMVEGCRRVLGDLGVPPERILSEADG